ncbi:hypothetical protein EB796_007347 [Bugula neritina]|uniref:Receptor ligand binding region domain-containing protein n=1 Tax=Bugula neritina TaxID=10212 RepID=A0A7J7K9R3_BUGNE|nr:hypothetical protein EB796_007347 [Bugula neritina]
MATGVALLIIVAAAAAAAAADATSILALYDDSPQQLAYDLAVQELSNETRIVYHPYQCRDGEIMEYVKNSSLDDDVIVVGGCCQHSSCQSRYPQIICSRKMVKPQPNVFNIMQTLESLYPALVAILEEMRWETVCIPHSEEYTQEIERLTDILSRRKVTVIRSSDIESKSCTMMSKVVILFEERMVCSAFAQLPKVLLALEKPKILCNSDSTYKDFHTYSLSSEKYILDTQVSRKLGYHFLANLNTDLTNLDLALCSYDSMKLVLSALAKESLSHETLSQVESSVNIVVINNSSEEVTYSDRKWG